MILDRQSLIISSPFERPTHHWVRKSDTQLALIAGRRPAGYEVFDTRRNTVRGVELPLVNRFRERVDQWRAADYPGVTAMTRQLLQHWRDTETSRQYAFYFCQLEAIETLIWWVEGSAEFKQGIAIPGDGGGWERLCNKMATGTGKTTVMAMIITWQVLNALTYPKHNKRFSRAIFIVAPGLTVKDRLKVLQPGHPDNYYDLFSLCPNEALRQKLNQVELLIENWHTLMPLKPPDRSVVRKGKESDEAFVRRVLGKLANCKDLVIINDEAHHAYRRPAELKISRKNAEELGIDLDEATRWIEGLDRVHKMRRIQRCFDLSATPFAPTGKTSTEAGLFEWVLSDFGLYEAIEAGLVKTPRVVVRDGALPNAKTYKPKLYHLYREPEVQDDFNRRGAEPYEPLPELVQQAYTLLGADWVETLKDWQAAGHATPPVMLTVCNKTETAARVEHYFRQGGAYWPELKPPECLLRVDSKVLDKAEIGETSTADRAYEAVLHGIVEAANIPVTRKNDLLTLKKEELLRTLVDTVGKRGQAGQDLRNVISVAMLSEGWDAKTVTHIMGLRAFTSQLLCEQVIGRGLRRVSYDTEPVACPDGQVRELFTPEFVNVFGVPLSIFQDVGEDGEAPKPPKPSIQIESLPDRSELEIGWPNVLRVDAVVHAELTLDLTQVPALKIDPAQVHVSAELAPTLGGTADLSKAVSIDLEQLPEEFRLQRLLFLAAHQALGCMAHGFKGSREYLVQQLVRLVERFFNSDRLDIPSLFHQQPLRKRILIALSIDAIVGHVVSHIQQQNSERLEPVFDAEFPLGSTRLMRTWYTTKPCIGTTKSQISHAVADSTWEQYTANQLESRAEVVAYAKNDHLGFQIYYLWHGSTIVSPFFAKPEMGPSDFRSKQLATSDGLRRPAFVLRPPRLRTPLRSALRQRLPQMTLRRVGGRRVGFASARAPTPPKPAALRLRGGRRTPLVRYRSLDFRVLLQRKFIPDFIIRLANGKLLVLEIKGEDSDQNRAKRMALDAWVRAVNSRGGFGVWCWDVVKAEPAKVMDVIAHHATAADHSEPLGEEV